MSFIQTFLKGYQNGCTTGEATTVFNSGQLVVDSKALRYTDDGNKNKATSATNNVESGLMYVVGDSKMIEALNAAKEGMAEDLISRGIAYQADTLDEAASAVGLSTETLTATVNAFNGYVKAGEDPEFGRTVFNGSVEQGPYYIVKLQMACHLTFGGLVIDTDSHVLDGNGNVIPGLYAAGDVISGYEGIVHQSGNCMTVVIHTGRVAGINAAEGK